VISRLRVWQALSTFPFIFEKIDTKNVAIRVLIAALVYYLLLLEHQVEVDERIIKKV
jgi:hypothetical protein